jgi:hypothetical protein
VVVASWQYLVVRKHPDGEGWIGYGVGVHRELLEELGELRVGEQALEACGQEGWELVAVAGDESGAVFYFKKPG